MLMMAVDQLEMWLVGLAGKHQCIINWNQLINVNPGLINHGLLIRGVITPQIVIIQYLIKWHPPN